MHVQILNFQLKDVSEADYTALANEIAPAFAAVPGLLGKVWLANSATGTYGGVYLWRDRAAMQDFSQTELFTTVATHPNLSGITATDFAVMEDATEVTHGIIGLG
jgi:heme-degrading monooxygenase HmoA